jgi:hypothetical protein
MIYPHFHCVSAENAKKSGSRIMSKPDYDHRCEHCKSLIIFHPSKREENGEYIPLDLNYKRHFCSSIDKILHECRAVERVKKIVDEMNSTDLSSFELELRIVDEVKK